MKIYFPNDDIKQEMLKCLIQSFKELYNYDKKDGYHHEVIMIRNKNYIKTIEKATGKKIADALEGE